MLTRARAEAAGVKPRTPTRLKAAMAKTSARLAFISVVTSCPYNTGPASKLPVTASEKVVPAAMLIARLDPDGARVRRAHPGPGNPDVAASSAHPVIMAADPDEIRSRAGHHHLLAHDRRRCVDTDADAQPGSRGDGRESESGDEDRQREGRSETFLGVHGR